MTLTTTPTTCINHADRETGARCNECQSPLCADCQTRLSENVYCAPCVARAKDNVVAQMTANPNLAGAAGAGLVVAAAGAFLWERVEVLSGSQFALIAIVIAVCVGNAVVFGAGGKRGPILQILSVALTALSLVLGNVMAVHSLVVEKIHPEDAWKVTFEVLPKVLEGMGPIGYLIIGIGLWEAYKFPRAPIVS